MSLIFVCAQEDSIPTAPAVPNVVEKRSEVFYAREPQVIPENGKIDQRVVQRMVDALLLNLTKQKTVSEAWKKLLDPKPGETVGIKVSTSGHELSGVHPQVVQAIVRGLQQVGFDRKHIIVWDKNYEDLVAAGFREKSSDYELMWIDPRTGYDEGALLTAPVTGKLIWGDRSFGDMKTTRLVDVLSAGNQLSNKSYYAEILSRRVDKVINVASLQDSFLSGVNGAMVSMALHNIDNWRRFTRPPHRGDPFIAEIFGGELIQEKLVVNFMDALYLQYAGGPFPNPNFTIENFMLLASEDAVSLDACARKFIDMERPVSKLPPVKNISEYIDSAEYFGLGIADEERINFIQVSP
ncbi:MAG: DUF362 domain-containing protein [Chthoniobacterales bacterium]